MARFISEIDDLLYSLEERPRYLFKLLIIGNCSTGKSSAIDRFCRGVFLSSMRYYSTIGIQIEETKLEEHEIGLKIWDTTGRIDRHFGHWYTEASGIMIFYDITNKDSFDAFKNWKNIINNNLKEDLHAVMLVGNKCDLEERRQVPKEMGERLAYDNGLEFIEISAKENIRVEEAFVTLATIIKAEVDKIQELEEAGRDSHADPDSNAGPDSNADPDSNAVQDSNADPDSNADTGSHCVLL